MDSIKSKVYSILAEQFLVSQDDLSDDIGPGDLPKWDSLGQIQLIVELEKNFSFHFLVDEIMSINSVKDIIQVVNKYQSDSQTESSDAIPSVQSLQSPLRHPSTTYWGSGSLNFLKNIDKNNVVLLTGKSEYAKVLQTRIRDLLKDRVVEIVERSSREPTEDDIILVAEQFRTHAPDAILAIGGGSTIDLAKLAWALYEHTDLDMDTLGRPFAIPNLGDKAKLIAVPTTFSGSEASSAATFNRRGSSNKTIALSHEFIPDIVILDPELGEGLGIVDRFAGAFDALTHAIEGWVSVVNNPMVEPYALSAIRGITNSLKLGALDLDALCYGAFWAGIVQNHCSVGLTHSIAHQLTGYGISHAKGTAAFLTPVMSYNNKNRNGVYDVLAKNLNFNSSESLIEALSNLYQIENIMPSRESLESILSNSTIIAESSMNDITFRTTPVSPSKEDIQSLIEITVKGYLE
jgi:alcohol dehydrogenase class IV/acyl carrier protein|tara:strand:- start:914 stop:2299 length:1386 start_codon:yes stop_codon:yes gene_type:complete